MAAKSIEHWLEDIRLLNEEGHSLAVALRALLQRQFQPLEEEIKYGGLLFASGPQFCGVFVYRQHVSLEFGHGTAIADALGLLEGSGKLRRHLKLRSLDDITSKQVAHYLALGLAAAQSAEGPP